MLDSTPRCLRLSRSGLIGLFLIDDLKTKVEDPAARAAIGIINRKVDPDSPQSSLLVGVLGTSTPVITQQSFRILILAPKAFATLMVACVSSEMSGVDILELPFDNKAATTVLWV
jgi:hypothetical protein